MEIKSGIKQAKTNLETSINEVFRILEKLADDNQNLKLKAYKPSVPEAKIFLDYLSWQEDRPKQNFETIYKKELEILGEWLDIYCEEQGCTKTDALERIRDGEI